MIKYSKIRYWILAFFVALLAWGSFNYLSGRDPLIPTVAFIGCLVVWLIIDKWSGWIKHDIIKKFF